ncbi:MAG: molybdopterin-dependent oxidoreductase [Deltaproteobacteria bacterium]
MTDASPTGAPQITIDGRVLAFEPGQTILDVANAGGIAIPTLCYLPEAGHRDVCRLCVVEVAGAGRLLPACSTPATEGMDVQTMSERVRTSRRATLELIIGSGRHTCITCEALGECELSRLAYEYQVEPPSELPGVEDFPLVEDAYVIRDYSKCILCGRCWAACTAIQVHGVVPHPSGRRAERAGGKDWYPLPDLDQCELCGQCVDACPVGALTERTAKGVARHWELQRIRTTCPHCGMGCQTVVHLKDGEVVKVTGAGDVPPNRGRLCKRGRFAVLEPDERARLEDPLIRRNGVLVKASWDEALDLVAEKLGRVGAGGVAGLIAPVCTNEEAYQGQKFFRAVLGTNDIDHRTVEASRVSIAATGTGAGVCYTSGALTVLEEARAVLQVGDRAVADHPVAGTALRRAVRDGAHLMVLDSGHSDLGDSAAVRLAVEPAAIPEILNGIIAVLLANELAGRRDAGEALPHERELEAMLAAVLPERIAEDAGVDAATIREIAAKLVDVRPAVVCATLGTSDDLAGTGAAVVKLQSLLDDLAGARSVSLPLGAGNVQGLLAMGVAPDVLPGGDLVTDAEARRRFAEAWGVEAIPDTPGRSTAGIVEAMAGGELKAAWVWANEAASFGDAGGLLAALGRADFVVVQGAMRGDLCAVADVVLPAVAWGEEDGTFTNAERRISRLRRVQRPAGAARPGWWAFREVARRLGHEWQAGYPKAVWEGEISLLIPSLGGVTYAEIDEYGLCWPAPAPVTA